jgi:prepilin peptidase CpaA
VGLSLLIYLPLYLVRGVGGGDVKLMLAMGAILGKSQWLVLFVFTAVLGGVIAVVILVLQGKLRKGFSNVLTILKAASQGKAAHQLDPAIDVANPKAIRLPHGVTIALGTAAWALSQ